MDENGKIHRNKPDSLIMKIWMRLVCYVLVPYMLTDAMISLRFLSEHDGRFTFFVASLAGATLDLLVSLNRSKHASHS